MQAVKCSNGWLIAGQADAGLPILSTVVALTGSMTTETFAVMTMRASRSLLHSIVPRRQHPSTLTCLNVRGESLKDHSGAKPSDPPSASTSWFWK